MTLNSINTKPENRGLFYSDSLKIMLFLLSADFLKEL